MPLLRSLEGLRLIASLGIVAIHFFPHYGFGPPIGFNLFVDMFFVISGIVIGSLYTGRIATPGDYATFVRRRLARIYPLHLATLLFYVALAAGMRHVHMPVDAARFDPARILPNLLLVQAWGHGTLAFNFVAWSISAEFFLYLAFPAIAWLVTRGGFVAGLAAVLALLAGAILWCERVYGTHLYLLVWDYGAVRALPSFALGIWLAAFAPRLIAWRPGRWPAHAFAIAALVAAIGIARDAPGYVLLPMLYAVVATAYLSDLRGLRTAAAWRPLSDYGYLTYSLYMLHVPVGTVFLSFVFPRLIGHGPAATWLSLGGSVLILIVAAEFSFRRFEDPLRRLLR